MSYTKIEAISKIMEDNNGVASWLNIYQNIEKYYPDAKQMKDWQAGIRGVLYRELRNNRTFKQVGLGIFALLEFKEQEKPKIEDKIRMHSYIEGICLELGNMNNYLTYTADPSAKFKDNISLNSITTLAEVPNFTYDEIIKVVKKIDVIWFKKSGNLLMPQKTFEIVDSLSTLEKAFNRSLKLTNFNTEFKIIAPLEFKKYFDDNISSEPYSNYENRFIFRDYENIINLYDATLIVHKLRTGIY